MALPVSFDSDLSVGTRNSSHPPFKGSDGEFYVVLRGTTGAAGTDNISLQNATDPTDSFAEVATLEIVSGVELLSIWSVQDGDTVHVSMQDTNRDVYYSSADLSGDSLSAEVQIEAITTPDDGPDANACSIAVESTGSDIVVAYQGDPDMEMGTEYARIDANRSDDSGATWGGPISIDNAGADHWTGPVIVLGSSDRMHIFFKDDTNDDGYQRTLTSGDSLETFPSSFQANFPNTNYNFGHGISYDDGGTQKVRCPFQILTGSNLGHTALLDSADAPTVTDEAVTGTNPSSGAGNTLIAGMASDGTDEHYLYADSSTQDLFRDVNTGSGWGTDTEVLDAITCNHVSPNVYDRSGQKLAYIYDDGGTVKYNEVVLGAAATTITASIDSLLQRQDILRTAVLDAKLLHTLTATASIDSILARTFTQTTEIDALLQRLGVTQTAQLDALLQRQGILRTASIDAILARTITLQASIDAILQHNLALTAQIDSLLKREGLTTTADIDAILVTEGTTVTAQIDALLQKTLSATAVLDAILVRRQSVTASVDALLQRLRTVTATIDAVLKREGLTKTASIDAILITEGTFVTAQIDALLQKNLIATAQIDALLQRRNLLTASIDARLSKVLTLSASVDAKFVHTLGISAEIDAVITQKGWRAKGDPSRPVWIPKADSSGAWTPLPDVHPYVP